MFFIHMAIDKRRFGSYNCANTERRVAWDVKLLALNGLLGYGYDAESLREAFREPPDYVGVDGGSVDPGPYYLGSGECFTDRNAVARDISLALALALKAGAPFVIGTGGGSGSRVHLEWLRDIVLGIAREQGLSMKLAVIYTDVTPEYAARKLREGRLLPMGPQLEATQESIMSSVRIVSQIGAGPIIEALGAGADVVLAGRACDTAIYAAPCIMRGYDPGLSFHMAKIMECGAMCATPVAAADCMTAEIFADGFTLTPASPARRCTVAGVAAHTMYEQGNPYFIYEPDGVADLRGCRYEQISDRTVRVSGSAFKAAETKTLKLEGVRRAGFRTIAIAGINDPQTIMRCDEIFAGVRAFVAKTLAGAVAPGDYRLTLRRYGDPLPGAPKPPMPTHGLGVIIDVLGSTQATADTVCALARARMLHFDYPGRKSTAGNLAFPYSPSDIHMGEAYEFSLYHLAVVDDLCETAVIKYETVGENA